MVFIHANLFHRQSPLQEMLTLLFGYSLAVSLGLILCCPVPVIPLPEQREAPLCPAVSQMFSNREGPIYRWVETQHSNK